MECDRDCVRSSHCAIVTAQREWTAKFMTDNSETQRTDRFALQPGEPTMMAVVTTGNGGFDKLDYRKVPVPIPGPREVLRVWMDPEHNRVIQCLYGPVNGQKQEAES